MTKFVTGLLVGAVLGAGIALLTAPNSGRDTRTRMVRIVRRSHGHDEDGDAEGGDDEDGDGADMGMDREEILNRLKRRRRKARR